MTSPIGNVLVTGASRGMGRALAVELCAAGAHVVGAGRDADALAETRRLCPPDLFEPVSLDIADEMATRRLFTTHGDIDVCIVNAGIAEQQPFADISRANIDRIFAVNVFGALATMQGAAAAMKRRGRGRIVVIGSDAAYRGIAGMASYVASKHALLGLARSLQLELDGTGVSLTIVHPGPVRTGILGAISAEGGGMDATEVARLIVASIRLETLRSVELRLHPGATT